MRARHFLSTRYVFLCVIALVIAICGVYVYAEEEGRLITIPQGIAMVLKDSRLIKISLFDKDIALNDSLLARSALLPQVSVNLTESILRYQPKAKLGSSEAPTAEKESLSYGFAVYQTLFDFGKSFSNFKASQELQNVTNARIDGVKKLAVLEFVTAYFNLLETEKLIIVAQKEVDTLGAYVSDIGHLYDQGAATKNDVLPVKVQLADAKQKLIAIRNGRATAMLRLNNILGLPLGENIRVEDIPMDVPQGFDKENAWRNAQAERPEIKVVTDQIKASLLTEKAKAADNFPVIFAEGGYSFADNQYQVHEDNTYINFGAKANIFDGWASKAGVYKERARRRQLNEQRNKLVEDIKFEIENSHLGLVNASEKVAVSREAVAQAAENVRVSRIKYGEGAATSTDVLAAVALETNAQTNYYNADYELKRSYAKLMYSMGIDLALFYDTINTKRGNDGDRK